MSPKDPCVRFWSASAGVVSAWKATWTTPDRSSRAELLAASRPGGRAGQWARRRKWPNAAWQSHGRNEAVAWALTGNLQYQQDRPLVAAPPSEPEFPGGLRLSACRSSPRRAPPRPGRRMAQVKQAEHGAPGSASSRCAGGRISVLGARGRARNRGDRRRKRSRWPAKACPIARCPYQSGGHFTASELNDAKMALLTTAEWELSQAKYGRIVARENQARGRNDMSERRLVQTKRSRDRIILP